MSSVSYSLGHSFPVRVYDHVCLGLQSNIQEHNRNLMEKIGDAGLWPVENLPRKVLDTMQDPRIVTVAVTSLLMFADSYLFYLEETTFLAKTAWTLLPIIPFWALKFSAYISTVEVIGSYGLRAEGRFTNKGLMDRFYGNIVNQ